MKKLALCSLGLFIAALVACESAPKKEPDVMPTADPVKIFVQSSNEQLANYPVAGFGYKSSQVPAQEWDKWAKAAAPVIKKVIDGLPEGHVLQVTGHTDASGPEEPAGRKPGNIKISSDRAKAVAAALKRQGITSPNLVSKGVGSSEPVPGIDTRDPRQRRVTFRVVPK